MCPPDRTTDEGSAAAEATTGRREGDIPGRTGHIFFVSPDLTGSHMPVKLLQGVSPRHNLKWGGRRRRRRIL